MPGQLEDPKYWDDLDSYKPKRFENNSIDFNGSHSEYVPFGAGRRICPGIPFGFANIELPLALLLYHFNRKLLNGPISSDFDMEDLVRIIAPTKKIFACLRPCMIHHLIYQPKLCEDTNGLWFSSAFSPLL